MHTDSLLPSAGQSEQGEQRSDMPSARVAKKENKCTCFSLLCNRHHILFNWIGGLILLVAPICTYIFDMVFDIMLIVEYLHNGDRLYSGLTFAFMALPVLVISIISGVNYYQRLQLKIFLEKHGEKNNLKDTFIVDSNGRFLFRFVFTFFFLSPVIRYTWINYYIAHKLLITGSLIFRPIDIFYYGLQYKKAVKNGLIKRSNLFQDAKEAEENQAVIFQLIESFMGNGPQLILQSYVLVQNVSNSFKFTLIRKFF